MNKKLNGLTGRQLFVQYGRPCLPIRFEQGKIDEITCKRLIEVLDKNLDPDVELIKVGLTDAYDAYLQYFEGSKGFAGELWSFDSVADYFRHRHNHPDNPGNKFDLWHATVVEICGDTVKVRVGAHKIIPIKNPRKLVVKEGDPVYIHKRCLIEIA